MHLDIVYSQIMTQKDIQAIKELLSEKKNIVIVHHKNADGDAIGSSVALNSYLNLCGHRSNIISPNNFPEFLKWLDNKKEIMIFNNSKNQINLIKISLLFAQIFVPRIQNLQLDSLHTLNFEKKIILNQLQKGKLQCWN